MDIFGVLQKNQDIVIGTVGGILVGPTILTKLSELINVGTYTSLGVCLGVAAGSVAAFGKARPAMAVSFASVFLAFAATQLFPQLQS